MPNLRVLIVDERPVRSRRLMQHLAQEARVEPVGPAATLTDAYNLTETHAPDIVCIGAEFVDQPEFMMYRALVNALGLRAVIYGPPGIGRRHHAQGFDTVTIPDSGPPEELLRALRVSPAGHGVRPPGTPTASSGPGAAPRCVVIGASTGGIEALLEILSHYPEECPPTLIVQHIRAEFVAGLVQRLDRHCRASVRAARNGASLTQGQVYVAPDDRHHLAIRPGILPSCRLVTGEPVSGHRPSADVLFRSAAALQAGTVGVLLTGMGRDGAEGLLEIRRNGGHTIVQDRQTCTVYGMPRAAMELGAATLELPLPRIGQAILQACREGKALAG